MAVHGRPFALSPLWQSAMPRLGSLRAPHALRRAHTLLGTLASHRHQSGQAPLSCRGSHCRHGRDAPSALGRGRNGPQPRRSAGSRSRGFLVPDVAEFLRGHETRRYAHAAGYVLRRGSAAVPGHLDRRPGRPRCREHRLPPSVGGVSYALGAAHFPARG